MSSTRASSFSDRKRESVLAAAKRSFLARGFAATNLDAVAQAAGVSKMTIYSHFGSKENLFMRVLARVIADHSTGGPALDADVEPSELQESLTAIAVDLIETVQDPEVAGLRRVLVAEQPRQPELASAWRRSAVLATVDELAEYFTSLQRRDLLAGIDPSLLATQFLWMLIGDPLDVALLDPGTTRTTPRAQATHAVRTLLAAYGGSEVPPPVTPATRRRA
jgi:TetR/AcrR family transcriptional regulator, mexJK operon transcriptional repressor